jgi:peptidoglycan biosynthesis protein MviN/MurJ (putative lipid II flippase)
MLLVLFTLGAGAIFKISAFAREAFIASRFGLSSLTDAYFALQQLPVTLATFMFGAFALAFTPAYAHEQQNSGMVRWLPGLLLYGSLFGLVLTALTLLGAPFLLGLFATSADAGTHATLTVLSVCYVPIIAIGICAGICTSYGRNLWSMTLTGLPYFVMTVALLLIYAAGRLSGLSLPVSMTAGFVAIGIFSAFKIFCGEKPVRAESYLQPWRFSEFRMFLRQLTASSVESLGFTGNQFLLIHFLAISGTGAISANNCASRIGMLGYSLLAQPLGQYMQGRMCITREEDRRKQFSRFLLMMALASMGAAALVFFARYAITEAVYMRGRFSFSELNEVVSILPAWLAYFVVLTLNSCVAKYLFISSRGSSYTRNMLCGYALANCLRFALAGHQPASCMIWCAVLGEGLALVVNLGICRGHRDRSLPMFVPIPEGQEI